MKFNARKKNSAFTLIECMVVIAIIGLLAAIAIPSAHAQTYFTNSTTPAGGYQYNDSLTVPLVPSAVIAQQKAAGILNGTSVTTTDGTVTNTFPVALYTAPPSIQVTQTGSTLTATDAVVSVTLTNFVYKAGAPNVTNTWISIGH